ncbi:Choline/ethanolamine kinase family protein [Tritrichomonas foetus]|uniref:ethanolamine kinase n=1 Tax=Tritrichomonas foetus TaxID=1144522 RepID=A0A1J4KK55_9EUKA|nr:Choline/ethanolamine kinase family protein [Tritrichomonas foetus]|eukprot:OHT10228.1 Choline/ethanolamine kinase family protein [Tritrichomonas foetus]
MIANYEEDFPLMGNEESQIDFLVKLLDISAPRHKVALKKMAGGITNAVFRLDTPSKKYVVRVFGNNTEQIIDRELEQEHIKKINFIEIYANFNNGAIVSYVEGRPIDVPMMGDRFISQKIAEIVGKFHSVTMYDNSEDSEKFEKKKIDKKKFEKKKYDEKSKEMSNYEEYCNNDISKPDFDNCHENEVFANIEKFINGLNPEYSKNGKTINIDHLREKLASLKAALSEEMKDSKIVLCHNDLLAANILWDGESCNLCDYEYSCYTWPEYDLANHFFEYCGFECDMSRYPSFEQQEFFLRNYLAAVNGCTPADVSEKTISKWIMKIGLLVKLSCFFWGCWAYFQASNSTVVFPYFEYAETRMMLMEYDLPLPEGHHLTEEQLVNL